MNELHVPKIAQLLSAITNLPRVALNPAIGVFGKLDGAVLSELQNSLRGQIKEIVCSQVEVINFAQMVKADKTEINLFVLRPWGIQLDRPALLPGPHDPYVLAKANVVIHQGLSCVAEIYVSGGRLFSIEFDRDVAEFRAVRPLRVEITAANPDVTAKRRVT